MNLKKLKRNEHAVSPVVGVMLMLVVTIIIAAVVSAFSGGLATGTKATPQASISVDISSTGGGLSNMNGGIGNESNAVFTLIGGDPLPTKDLEIITYYTNSTGITLKHEQTAASPAVNLYATDPTYGPWDLMGRVPYLNDLTKGFAGSDPPVDFGNFTWQPGENLATGGIREPQAFSV